MIILTKNLKKRNESFGGLMNNPIIFKNSSLNKDDLISFDMEGKLSINVYY